MNATIENYLENSSFSFVKIINSKEIYVKDHFGTYKTTLYRLKEGQYPTCQTVVDYPNWIIKKSEQIHGNVYSYRIPEGCTKTIHHFYVYCDKHGEYKTNYTNHIFKQNGCKQCYVDTLFKNDNYFLEKANQTHKDTYDYSQSSYVSMKTKVKILCKLHGIFEQTPDKHIRGQGCPTCSKLTSKICGYSREDFVESSYRSNIKPYLYIIKCFDESEMFYKIGITASELKVRFSGKKLPYKYEIIQKIENKDPSYIYDLEKSLNRLYKQYQYKPLKDFNGYTECYKI